MKLNARQEATPAREKRGRSRLLVGALAAAAVVPLMAQPAAAGSRQGAVAAVRADGVSPVVEVSKGCRGQNAETEEAVDPRLDKAYVAWIGCGGIGFARSMDGGRHFGPPRTVPGSGSTRPRAAAPGRTTSGKPMTAFVDSKAGGSWDPAVAVAPNGTVYVAFMVAHQGYTYPVVATSFDHGASFSQVSSLVPPYKQNWGDRDFIAVGPHGDVYVTWDYGPSAAAVTYICSRGGSCAFATGDLNVVVQKSVDGGRTWGPIIPVSPGFPASGGDSAPLVIEPDGRVDVAYQGYQITNPVTYTMKPAHTYFTSSVDGGKTWSAPVRVGPADLTMSKAEWWIDGSIGLDAAGNLYATWDTQSPNGDIGWLSYSTNHGRIWSHLVRVTPDRDHAVHIVEVAGAGRGVAEVGWQTDASLLGYATYLRPFSVTKGWLAPAIEVSDQFGNPAIWPGDTFGISPLSAGTPDRVAFGWGSAVGASKDSEIFAAVVSLPPGFAGG